MRAYHGRESGGGGPEGEARRWGRSSGQATMAAEVEEPILVGGSSSEAQEGGVVVWGEVGEVLVKGIGERQPCMAGINYNSCSARARARG